MRYFENLLLRDSSAGDATARRLHADCGRPERDRTPEGPATRVDRGRGNESPRARAADGRPIVDLDTCSEASIGESGRGALDPQLTLGHGELRPIDRHRIR